ncbi:hypothetical protein Natoc_1070 [Natronococcus occultus SP4]|uniref:Uncharacterized protein n=1 Tax=Natronococcus occultus SP4 TaxID=694430 RepID=L0JV75_9EURY|nr:hypothetical protein Natoc_1070 [Natronococcus occultus SP4]
MAGEYGTSYSKFEYDYGTHRYVNPYHEEEEYDCDLLDI